MKDEKLWKREYTAHTHAQCVCVCVCKCEDLIQVKQDMYSTCMYDPCKSADDVTVIDLFCEPEHIILALISACWCLHAAWLFRWKHDVTNVQ